MCSFLSYQHYSYRWNPQNDKQHLHKMETSQILNWPNDVAANFSHLRTKYNFWRWWFNPEILYMLAVFYPKKLADKNPYQVGYEKLYCTVLVPRVTIIQLNWHKCVLSHQRRHISPVMTQTQRPPVASPRGFISIHVATGPPTMRSHPLRTRLT